LGCGGDTELRPEGIQGLWVIGRKTLDQDLTLARIKILHDVVRDLQTHVAPRVMGVLALHVHHSPVTMPKRLVVAWPSNSSRSRW
jgi:hypothetical protein